MARSEQSRAGCHAWRVRALFSATRGEERSVVAEPSVQIVVLHATPPCPKCVETEKLAREVAAGYGEGVVVRALTSDDPEADKYGVLLTPTVLVNDLVVAVGVVPRKERLAQAIEEELSA